RSSARWDTPLFLTAATKAMKGCIASGISIAGFFIRGCIVFILLSLFLISFLFMIGPQTFAPSQRRRLAPACFDISQKFFDHLGGAAAWAAAEPIMTAGKPSFLDYDTASRSASDATASKRYVP